MDDDLLTPQPLPQPASQPQPIGRKAPLLKLDEVADLLRCTRRSLERQIAADQISVIHVGRSVRIEPAELDAYLDRLRLAERLSHPADERRGQTA